MQQGSTLHALIKDGNLPASLAHRMTLARDVARTMEYLHSVQLLLKSLSDESIVVLEDKDVLIPYVTGIESAREVRQD